MPCVGLFHLSTSSRPSIQVTFSNPAEVAKTRLQLQGELVKGGGEKVYGSVFDVFTKTWRNEGIRGIQRGLPPAVRVGHLLLGATSDLGLFFSMHTR